jgi:hypothetical protein
MKDKKVRILKALTTVIMITGIAVLTSCESYVWTPPEIPDDIIISFSDHLYPVCQECHPAWSQEKTYDELSARVDTVNPASSQILSMHGSIFDTRMVQVNDTLSIKAADAIQIWASQGAEYNK